MVLGARRAAPYCSRFRDESALPDKNGTSSYYKGIRNDHFACKSCAKTSQTQRGICSEEMSSALTSIDAGTIYVAMYQDENLFLHAFEQYHQCTLRYCCNV